MRPLLRLAVRDARRHLRRTILAVLLIALPAFGFIGYLGATLTAPPSAESALATVPRAAQAVLTATAIRRPAPPFEQLPEGAPGVWLDDPDQLPATSADLAAHLSPKNRLLPYWNSPSLLAAKGIEAKPGDVRTAGEGTANLASVGLHAITKATLREASPEAFALLAPNPTQGTLPASPSDLLITTALADRLGLRVGDDLTLVAPPSTGWMSTDGRIAEAIANSQKTFRVSGIAPGKDEQALALAGWISAMASADPKGVDGHYLVVGPDPVTWAQAKELNNLQAFAVSRHVLTHYPPANELYPVAVSPAQILSRLATAIALGGLGAALVLGLVTPAFAVATEQQRRLLGLAPATGATPRDLRRMITAQGIVVGVLGGLLGSTLGVAGALMFLAKARPDSENLRYFPWWSLVVALVIAALLGWVTTLLPARWASRQQPIDALRGRAPQAAPSRTRSLAGPLVLAVALVCAVVSLRLPVPDPDPGAPPGTGVPALQSLLMVGAVGGAILGLVLCVPLLLAGAGRLGRALPLAPRAALQDAARHLSRTVPATAAVLVSVMAIAFGLVMSGSNMSDERDSNGTLITYGHLLLGAQVPVSDGFDRAVLLDALALLKQRYPVTGSQPVYAYPTKQKLVLSAAPAPGKACPKDLYPDTRSGVEPDAPLRCVVWDRAFHPGQSGPWWIGGDVYVMDGAAVRATGRADAEEAARVLDAGGVLVNDATRAADGHVDVVTSRRNPAGDDTPLKTTRLPGRYVQGFGAPLVVSPKAAKTLGLTNYIYVGEVVEVSRPLRPWESSAAARFINANAPLAWLGMMSPDTPWGGLGTAMMVTILLGIAVLATTVSVLLARTQAESDLATMHAVGATRPFLRRFITSGAGVMLAIGAPLGLLAGLAVGSYLVAWNRLLGVSGAYRLTVPLWPVQGISVLLVVLVGLAVAWLASRPPRDLTTRLAD